MALRVRQLKWIAFSLCSRTLFWMIKIVVFVEITALALSYHLYNGVRHLLTDFSGFLFLRIGRKRLKWLWVFKISPIPLTLRLKKKFIFLLNFTLIAVAILRYYVFVPCPVSWRVKGKEERLVCQAYNFHDVSVFLMSGWSFLSLKNKLTFATLLVSRRW